MKKTICSLVLIAALTQAPNAQENKASGFEQFLSKVAETAESVYSKGKTYAEKKFYEAKLENQIENSIDYEIPDKEVRNFFDDLGLEQKINADISQVSEKSVMATLEFKYDYDKTKIYRQYEFSVKDDNIGKVTDTGRTWVKSNGETLSLDDWVKSAKLKKSVYERWTNKKEKYEKRHNEKTLVFSYDKDAFAAIEVPTQEILFDNPKSAKVGIRYNILDKFGNTENNVAYYFVEQYNFKRGKWIFDELIYESKLKKEKKEQSIEEKAKEYLGKGYDYMKSILD